MSTVASVRVIASSVMLSAREVSEAIEVNCGTRETNETHDMLVVDLLPLLDELTTSLILVLTSSIELIIEDKVAILLFNSATDKILSVEITESVVAGVVILDVVAFKEDAVEITRYVVVVTNTVDLEGVTVDFMEDIVEASVDNVLVTLDVVTKFVEEIISDVLAFTIDAVVVIGYVVVVRVVVVGVTVDFIVVMVDVVEVQVDDVLVTANVEIVTEYVEEMIKDVDTVVVTGYVVIVTVDVECVEVDLIVVMVYVVVVRVELRVIIIGDFVFIDVSEVLWTEEEVCNKVDFNVEIEEDILVVYEVVGCSVVSPVVLVRVVRVGIFIGISYVN